MHYDHEPLLVEGWQTIDIRTVIARHEDEWLGEIEAWHRTFCDLGATMTRWWGLLPASRLILWPTTTTFGLKAILYARAVIDQIRADLSGTYWLICAPRELREYLSEWASSNNSIQIRELIISGPGDRRDSANSRIASGWANALKQLVLLVVHMGLRRRRKMQPSRVLVNSLVLNPDVLKNRGDHFFGKMLDNIEFTLTDNISWLYNDIVLDQQKSQRNLNQIGRRGYFISDIFSFKDIWFGLQTTIAINWSLRNLRGNTPELKIDGACIPSFSYNYRLQLINKTLPIIECIYYQIFKRAITQSRPEVIMYPYEEKPLERAILLAARDCGRAIKTIGFAHAAYSKGHLYIRRGTHGEPPRPSCIAVTGEVAKSYFHNMGVPMEQLTTIGSPRYIPFHPSKHLSFKKSRHKILFIVGHGFELRHFAAMTEVCPRIFENFSLLVRRYPYSWHSEQDEAEARLTRAGVKYATDGRDLISQLKESDFILFESTSAAMEAVLLGRVVIQVKLTDTLSSNQFLSLGGQNVIEYCKTAKELKNLLERMAKLSPQEYAELALRQRYLVQQLYSPIIPIQLKHLLSDIKI